MVSGISGSTTKPRIQSLLDLIYIRKEILAKRDAELARMISQLTGPRLPAARGKADRLVIFCHGYGADGNDLITIDEETERVIVEAHTDEHGDPWDKVLDPNAQVKVV